ncbi:Gfo/Idh/MocA family protein [Mobiluncus mulieris]|uniref:Gfo/Idh/MocA family protein n=1 Tax=Mobiluncus mulieris TaxID=2052 RepID=UPI0021E33DE0|nr:Gfo/Idh/MocA family oxidoreductase [Mobiluncus mulieris]MCV0009061.1 Gfo/Idh/MocA family oxidoreductase [Mobiluncus mulieris]
MTINYGVVGSGYFGTAEALALQALDGANVWGIYDPENAAEPAAKVGAQVYKTMEELVRDPDVQAIVVASPNGKHVEPVLVAAEAKKAIFCEKPIALNYADCKRMVDAAKQNGVFFMAGHVMNFMNGVRLAKKIIREGKLGKVLFVRAVRNGWEGQQPSVSWKKIRELSGGHLYHHIHELDCVQSILGPAQSATMIGGNVAHRGEGFGDEDDMLLIQLRFPNGAFATLEYGSAFRWPEHYVLIQGEKGAIKIDMQNTGVSVRIDGKIEHYLLHRNEEEDAQRTAIYANSETDGAVQYGNPHKVPPLWLAGIVEEEMRYFHGLMQGAKVDPEFAKLTDGTAAMEAIATADAATRSLKEGRTVKVSEITGE